MSLLSTLDQLLRLGVYPRDRWYEEDDEEEDEGGGDDSGDDGGGDDEGGDDGGDQGSDDGGGDDSGSDDSGGDFDWGDSGDDSGGDDSGWTAVEDYEEDGRKIRKFTDNTGTDYFQDVGEWESSSATDRSSSGDGFDWGDTNQRDDWMRGDREMPDVDPDIRDLHDYYHPYTVSKYDDDPVRKGWGDGVAADGTRFDQQDEATRSMFGSSFGDDAPRSWAEQRSRDLEAEYRQRGVVTLPQQQETDANGQPREYTPTSAIRTSRAPEAPPSANVLGLGAIGAVPAPTTINTPAEPVIPDYVPPAIETPAPTPPTEATTPQPQSAAPPAATTAPPAGQQAAADAAARATAQAGGSPQQVADAAAAAALSYDRRTLSSESPETQRQFQQAFGDQADERWVQQHNQELALNRALYGTAEPRAGARQTGAVPGLGDVGPAPDRTIGQAQAAPWNRPATASPGAVTRPGAAASPGAQGLERPTDILTIEGEGDAARVARSDWDQWPSEVKARWNVTNAVGLAQAAMPMTPPPAAREAPPTTGALPVYNTPAEPPSRGNIPPMPPGLPDGPGGVPRGAPNSVVQGPPITETGGIPLASPIPSDAPTQTMAEAGFERTSAMSPIDASLRQAANVPLPPPAESPDDILTIVDPEMGRRMEIPRSRWEDVSRPVAPGVPNPWRVVDARPADGAPPPPPPAPPAPPPPAPAGPGIDASVRAAAGLLPGFGPTGHGFGPQPDGTMVTPRPLAPGESPFVNYDADQGPREGGRAVGLTMSTDPFGFLASVAADQQKATDVESFGRNVAAGISAGEAWAEPFAADLGRLAWYRETRGLEGDPTQAPDSYVRDWMGAFKAGNENVTGVREMSQALVDRGVAPPSSDPFGTVVSQAAREQGATDMAGFKRAVAGGIAAGEAWTRPYTEQLARQAWYRESGGREGGPENAPQSFVNDWTSALRAADSNVPGVKAINQQLINLGARMPAPNNQPFNWQAVYGPTGEGRGANGPGLISQQFTGIDCGPNAFSNIMRSQGYNAAPKDAFSFAKERGYHSGEMFNGPGAYVNMLQNELGLKAQQGRIDWGKVDQELAEGRLVTLSSPGGTGHYWTIAAKNDKGEYYTGATGTFVGHSAWARPNQITFKNNPPDTMITYSGAIDPKSRAVTSPTLKVTPPPTPAPTMVSAPGRTQMQSTEGAGERPAAQIAADPRMGEAGQEDVWSSSQPTRHALMTEFQQRPKEERQVIFDDAIEQGMDAEGITDPGERQRWKTAMYEITTGTGRLQGTPAEDPDLNPFMISGEFGGRPRAADQSSATGYFQLIQTNPPGTGKPKDYAFMGYIPAEYQGNPYHPVGQVRQLIRATKASTFRGDPDRLVDDKRRNKHYNIVVQRREPW